MRTLVLDSNVVLDWLLFNMPSLAALRAQVTRGQLRILRDAYSCQELQRVLDYPVLKLTPDRQAAILNDYLLHTDQASLPTGYSADALQLPALFPQCRDHDDQPFLALCFHGKADALVTRDKALLKLRKRAAKFGVRIVEGSALAEWL